LCFLAPPWRALPIWLVYLRYGDVVVRDVLIKLIVKGGILLLPPDDFVIIQLRALFLQECILAGLNVALAECVGVTPDTHTYPDPTAHLALLA
jgi:hypothetical protein